MTDTSCAAGGFRLKHLAAGGCAELVPILSKWLLQTRQLAIRDSPHNVTFRSTIAVVHKSCIQHGAIRFFSQYLATPLIDIPQTAVRFALYQFYKDKLKDHEYQRLSFSQLLCCSLAAATTETFITHPMNNYFVSKLMRKQSNKTYKTHVSWIRSLYSGVKLPLMLMVPTTGLQFALYDVLKGFRNDCDNSILSLTYQFVCAGVGFGLGLSIMYPFKQSVLILNGVRLNTFEASYALSRNPLRTLISDRGFKYLFRGLSSSVLHGTPIGAVRLVSFDIFRRYFCGN